MNRFVATTLQNITTVPNMRDMYEQLIADVYARYYRMTGDPVLFLTGCTETSDTVDRVCTNSNAQRDKYFHHLRNHHVDIMSYLGISANKFASTIIQSHQGWTREFFYKHINPAYYKIKDFQSAYCSKCDETRTNKSIGECCPEHPNTVLTPLIGKMRIMDLKNLQLAIAGNYEGVNRLTSVLPANILKKINVKRFQEVIPVARYRPIGSPLDILNGESKMGVLTLSADSWVDNVLAYWTHSVLDDEHHWPVDILVTNKRKLWQDAVLFPALMTTAGWLPAKRIICRGNIEFEKNTPPILVSEMNNFGADAVRYYLLNRVVTTSFLYKTEELIRQFNSDIFPLSGLATRIHRMMWNYGQAGKLRGGIKATHFEWLKMYEFDDYQRDIESGVFNHAIKLVLTVAERINNVIKSEQPWELFQRGNFDRLTAVLKGILCGMRLVAALLTPLLPNLAQYIDESLGYPTHNSWSYLKYLCTKNNTSGMTVEITAKPGEIQPLYKRVIRNPNSLPIVSVSPEDEMLTSLADDGIKLVEPNCLRTLADDDDFDTDDGTYVLVDDDQRGYSGIDDCT